MDFSPLKGSPAFSAFPLLQEHTLVDPIELPSTAETFVLPSRILEDRALLGTIMDREVVPYLPGLLASVVPDRLVPMRTCGDGNCLLNALSTAMWGLEKYHKLLRQQLVAELTHNIDWYKTTSKHRDVEEWDAAVEMAEREGSFLEFIHIFAIANVLQRPIIIHASDADRETFGDGEGGVTACFLPTRCEEGCVSKKPLLLSWGNEHRNHFIPLVPVEGGEVPLLRVGLAFSSTLNETPVEDYLDFTAESREPSLVAVLRRQIKLLLDADYEVPVHYNGTIYTLRLRDDDNALTKVQEFMDKTGIPVEYKLKILHQILSISAKKPRDISKTTVSSSMNRARGPSIPVQRFFSFNNAGTIDKALQKVLQLNNEVEPFMKLPKRDLELLKKVVEKVKETGTQEQKKLAFPPEEIDVVTRLMEWPAEQVFPAFDIARMLLIFDDAAEYLCTHMASALDDRNLLSLAVEKVRETEKPPVPAYMLLLRIMANLFHTERGCGVAEAYAKVLLLFLDECLQLTASRKVLYPACYKLMSNFALLAAKSPTFPRSVKLQFVMLMLQLLPEGENVDEATTIAVLDALGTLFYYENELCNFLQDRMDIARPFLDLEGRNPSDGVRSRAKTIVEILFTLP